MSLLVIFQKSQQLPEEALKTSETYTEIIVPLTFTYSKTTIETLEKSKKYLCLKLTTKTPKRRQ